MAIIRAYVKDAFESLVQMDFNQMNASCISWRGYGVDVEALRDRIPLWQIPEKAPRWDLTGTEGCGGGKVVSWIPPDVFRV